MIPVRNTRGFTLVELLVVMGICPCGLSPAAITRVESTVSMSTDTCNLWITASITTSGDPCLLFAAKRCYRVDGIAKFQLIAQQLRRYESSCEIRFSRADAG